MVAAQAAVCLLLCFLAGHTVFHTVKIVNPFTGFSFRKLYTSARYAVVQIRLRNLHVTGNLVMESQILVDVGGNNFCGGDGPDYGRRSGRTVSSGKYRRIFLP